MLNEKRLIETAGHAEVPGDEIDPRDQARRLGRDLREEGVQPGEPRGKPAPWR